MIIQKANSSVSPCGRFRLQAYFTVEASLLMCLILPVLISLMLAGFFVHDRVFQQGNVSEAAAMGSNLQEYSSPSGKLSAICASIRSQGFLWGRDIGLTFSVTEQESLADASGRFPVPGLAMQYLSGGNLPLGASWSRKIYHPAKAIRRIRGAAALVSAVTGS